MSSLHAERIEQFAQKVKESLATPPRSYPYSEQNFSHARAGYAGCNDSPFVSAYMSTTGGGKRVTKKSISS